MMKSIREQYWRYSLFVIIVGLGVAIFVELTPYLGGLLGAMTLYVLLRGQMCRLTTHRRWHRSWAAALLLLEAVVCFLIPLQLVVWLFADRIQGATLDPQSLVEPLRHLARFIRERSGYDLLQESNVSSLVAALSKIGKDLLQGIFSFGVNIIILLFVLYFMLTGGPRMESTRDVLNMVHDSLKAGGSGLSMGRNVFAHPRRVQMVRALRALVHEDADVETALKIVGE